tara:strand:- start:5151 stop:5561 length:411 start_codon:yes stop_codon:yes gene_type:complete
MLLSFIYTLLISKNNYSPLPPINNIYYTCITIPLIGKQDILYERKEKLISKLKLSGKVNVNGYIYFNNNNYYDYTIDDNLNKILKKYKCSFLDPYYDNNKDIISFEIRLNLLRYTKKLRLYNIKSNYFYNKKKLLK